MIDEIGFDEYWDSEYENWRAASGFITNFEDSRKPIYVKAILEYMNVPHHHLVWIGDCYDPTCMMNNYHGLYCKWNKDGPCGLDEFWEIFEKIEKEVQDVK